MFLNNFLRQMGIEIKMFAAKGCSLANDIITIGSVVADKEMPFQDEISIGLSVAENKLKKSCGYGYYSDKDYFNYAVDKSAYIAGKFANKEEKKALTIGNFIGCKLVKHIPQSITSY